MTKTLAAAILFGSLTLGALSLGAWVGPDCCTLNASAASEGSENVKTVVFHVTGMTCGGCEAAVRMAVKRLDGVQKVTASHEKDNAVVTFDPLKVKPADIKAAIEKVGYKAELEKKKEPQGNE